MASFTVFCSHGQSFLSGLWRDDQWEPSAGEGWVAKYWKLITNNFFENPCSSTYLNIHTAYRLVSFIACNIWTQNHLECNICIYKTQNKKSINQQINNFRCLWSGLVRNQEYCVCVFVWVCVLFLCMCVYVCVCVSERVCVPKGGSPKFLARSVFIYVS